MDNGPTHLFIALNAFGQLLQVVVVASVHITKIPDQVASFQARAVRRTPGHDTVDFGKRTLQNLQHAVPQDGGGLARGASWLVSSVLKTGKMLMKVFLDPCHQVFIVVPQMYDARPGCSDCA